MTYREARRGAAIAGAVLFAMPIAEVMLGLGTAGPVHFIVGTLGARFGNHTSYQSSAANRALGTPRGGLRTVPMRSPSFGARLEPSRTILTVMR